jgi:FtsP/CotA-like multicopper oxidase with cupredoxin domain
MRSRRELLRAGAVAGGAAFLGRALAFAADGPAPAAPFAAAPPPPADGYRPVVTPAVGTLPHRIVDGVKEFRLVAEPVRREFGPGTVVDAWGYNGSTPGPTIEAVEGDRVRILVENRLPEKHAVHWHGLRLPNGMDGVGGLTQPHIPPGRTMVYEFTLRQHGTQMYHSHSDEMFQMALGMYGFFVIHPKAPAEPLPDRDYCLFLGEWAVHPGTRVPDPMVMLDFNLFTFNGKMFPAVPHLLARTGDRVRIRIANVTMDNHPIHVHGLPFEMIGTDGGAVPPSARHPETTTDVPPGTTRTVELLALDPGDWAFHCHKTHHTMGAMGHDVPNLLGVSQEGLEERIQKLLPGYMAMGEKGMGEMGEMPMPLPANTAPMMTGQGPFGPIEMGSMFTVFKVRDDLRSYDEDPGWYRHPEGTVSRLLPE